MIPSRDPSAVRTPSVVGLARRYCTEPAVDVALSCMAAPELARCETSRRATSDSRGNFARICACVIVVVQVAYGLRTRGSTDQWSSRLRR
nr:hypothetical protein [Cellulomonas sp. PSBB021]